MDAILKTLTVLLTLCILTGCIDKDGLSSDVLKSLYLQYKVDVAAGRNPSLEELENKMIAQSSFTTEARVLLLKLYKERENKIIKEINNGRNT